MHILLLVQQTVQLLWNSQNGSQRHRWLVIFPLYFCQCFVSFVNILFGSGLKFCWVLGTRCCGGLLHLPMRILRAGAVPFTTHQCNVQAWTALIHVWREYAWIGERTLRTNLGAERGRAICKPILLSTDNRVERSAPDTAESFSFQSESWKLLHFRHFSALVQC